MQARSLLMALGFAAISLGAVATSPVSAATSVSTATGNASDCKVSAAMPHFSEGTTTIVDTKAYGRCTVNITTLKAQAYLYYVEYIGFDGYWTAATPSQLAVNHGERKITSRHSEVNCTTIDINPTEYQGEATVWINGVAKDAPVQGPVTLTCQGIPVAVSPN